ncbi:hypothetical protein PSE_2992 [Pseudovibrio sp. FO-BEG1]|nr:hypothetical protein PSE_2992 [Pseudovibrio sp. FO-BEG1]
MTHHIRIKRDLGALKDKKVRISLIKQEKQEMVDDLLSAASL